MTERAPGSEASSLDAFLKGTRPPRAVAARLYRATTHQAARSVRCPETPRLDGRVALVTGGSAGIGFETTRGLLRRGAEVVIASRNAEQARAAVDRLRGELGEGAPVGSSAVDLADLDSVARCAAELEGRLGPRTLDVVVANAGAMNARWRASPQGHEHTFATNVLGHFLLLRRLLPRLGPGARVVVVTGDLYCLVRACTPDYPYRTRLGGLLAYARSKLGDLWLARELQRRRPDLVVVTVHPGVVDSNFGRSVRGVAPSSTRPARWPRIDCEAGAQASLAAATQPGVEAGAYYHNTLGRVDLPPGDPALDADAARALWERCEALAAPWLDGR